MTPKTERAASANRRLTCPLDAARQFGRTVHAQPCLPAAVAERRVKQRASCYFCWIPIFLRNGSRERLRPRNFSMDTFASRESPGA